MRHPLNGLGALINNMGTRSENVMDSTNRSDDLDLTLAGGRADPAGTAWPEQYSEAARAIDAERIKTPHDAPLYWSYFPGTD